MSITIIITTTPTPFKILNYYRKSGYLLLNFIFLDWVV